MAIALGDWTTVGRRIVRFVLGKATSESCKAVAFCSPKRSPSFPEKPLMRPHIAQFLETGCARLLRLTEPCFFFGGGRIIRAKSHGRIKRQKRCRLYFARRWALPLRWEHRGSGCSDCAIGPLKNAPGGRMVGRSISMHRVRRAAFASRSNADEADTRKARGDRHPCLTMVRMPLAVVLPMRSMLHDMRCHGLWPRSAQAVEHSAPTQQFSPSRKSLCDCGVLRPFGPCC